MWPNTGDPEQMCNIPCKHQTKLRNILFAIVHTSSNIIWIVVHWSRAHFPDSEGLNNSSCTVSWVPRIFWELQKDHSGSHQMHKTFVRKYRSSDIRHPVQPRGVNTCRACRMPTRLFDTTGWKFLADDRFTQKSQARTLCETRTICLNVFWIFRQAIRYITCRILKTRLRTPWSTTAKSEANGLSELV